MWSCESVYATWLSSFCLLSRDELALLTGFIMSKQVAINNPRSPTTGPILLFTNENKPCSRPEDDRDFAKNALLENN